MFDSRDASHEDAQIILRLYELRREEKLRQARDWFNTQFFPESFEDVRAALTPGGREHAWFRMVTSYWDMAASFVVHGALHAGLLLESSGEMLLLWAKMQPFARQIRDATGVPFLANVEKIIEGVPGAAERAARLQKMLPQYRDQGRPSR